MGSVIKHAATPLDGYMTGFTINAVIMVASGVLGLLLLWPNSERARLNAAAGTAEVCVRGDERAQQTQLSSRRRPGPITTGFCCSKGN